MGSITFLVTVNDSWKWDPPISNDTCMVTVKTDPLYPKTPLNKSEPVMVGSCDNGPLVYNINSDGAVFLTFHSSVILDASPYLHHSLEWELPAAHKTTILSYTGVLAARLCHWGLQRGLSHDLLLVLHSGLEYQQSRYAKLFSSHNLSACKNLVATLTCTPAYPCSSTQTLWPTCEASFSCDQCYLSGCCEPD